MVLDSALETLLTELGQMGNQYQILTNSTGFLPNHRLSRHIWETGREILSTGARRCREYQSRHAIHAKTYVIDGRMTVIGSYNLDPRSYYIDRACTAHRPGILPPSPAGAGRLSAQSLELGADGAYLPGEGLQRFQSPGSSAAQSVRSACPSVCSSTVTGLHCSLPAGAFLRETAAVRLDLRRFFNCQEYAGQPVRLPGRRRAPGPAGRSSAARCTKSPGSTSGGSASTPPTAAETGSVLQAPPGPDAHPPQGNPSRRRASQYRTACRRSTWTADAPVFSARKDTAARPSLIRRNSPGVSAVPPTEIRIPGSAPASETCAIPAGTELWRSGHHPAPASQPPLLFARP